MIPNDELRAQVEAELPELPMALLEDALRFRRLVRLVVWVPAAERGHARRGRARRSLGWSVLEDVGNHLDVVNRAGDIAVDLIRIGS